MNDMARRLAPPAHLVPPPPLDTDPPPPRFRPRQTGPFGVLDIGTTKIACIIGRCESDLSLRVLGFGWQKGRGVRAGVRWDGTFYRDLNRYANSGPLFWSAYLKPGSAPGNGNGFWLNFGSGWAHLANDDPAQLPAGASPRILYDSGAGEWRLVIEATLFVTNAVVNVWTGAKAGGNDPAGIYTRASGCDPLASLTVAAV